MTYRVMPAPSAKPGNWSYWIMSPDNKFIMEVNEWDVAEDIAFMLTNARHLRMGA